MNAARLVSDMSFSESSVLGTCLYARKSPAVGGDTIWSNQMLAFDALSPAMQRMLEGQKVMHSAKRYYRPQGTYADDHLKSMRIKVSEEALKEQARPCIRTHSESGRKQRLRNRLTTILNGIRQRSPQRRSSAIDASPGRSGQVPKLDEPLLVRDHSYL